MCILVSLYIVLSNTFNTCTNDSNIFQFIDMIMNIYSLGIASMCIELSVIEKLYPLFIDMQRKCTPLHYATKNGDEKIVEQLLKAGASHSAVDEVST